MTYSSVGYTEGSGKDVKTDVVDGKEVQFVKVGLGGEGVADEWDGSVTVSGVATAANQDTGNTSLASIDGKITACDTGSVTISAALPAGTNAIGKLAANSGVDIGDVTINNSSIPVTDNAGSLTVDAPVGTPVFVRLSDGSSAITTLPVSLASVPSHAVTNAGTFAVQVDGNALTSLQLIDDAVATTGSAITTKGFAVSGTDGTNARVLKTDSSGELQVDILTLPALAAGTNGIGKLTANSGVDIGDVDVVTCGTITPGTGATNLGKAEDAQHASGDVGVMALAVRAASPTERSAGPSDGDYEPLGVNEVGALWCTPTPSANGGCSIFRSIDLDETEEDVKTSAGCVYGMWVTNTATSTRWIKFYNATAANVTVGSTTPVITWGVPGNSSDDVSGVFGGGFGVGFGTAICVAATTGIADNDTGAPGANEVIVNIFYK